jgi:hypothetical protein
LTSTVEADWFQSGNPVPAISALSPSGVQAGSPSFTLTVNGTSFISNSVVRWNGAGRATTFVSATRLTVFVSSSDITATGTVSITVFNPAPNGSESKVAALQINNKTNTTITPHLPNPSAQGASVTTTNSVVYLPFISKAPTPQSMYLPLIAKAPIATPTPIPNPVVNGGFEQGSFKWYGGLAIPYDANPQGLDLTTQRNQLPSPVTPHSGDWVAWMGGYQNSRTNLQTADPFLVPAGGSTLRYWYWIQSDESNCDAINTDGAWVYFSDNQNNYAVDSYALCTASRSPGWLKRDIDLSPYVGRSGWLSFIERNVGQNSNWFLDDVQLGTLASGQFKPVTR